MVADPLLLCWDKDVRPGGGKAASEEELPALQVQSFGRVSHAEGGETLRCIGLLRWYVFFNGASIKENFQFEFMGELFTAEVSQEVS